MIFQHSVYKSGKLKISLLVGWLGDVFIISKTRSRWQMIGEIKYTDIDSVASYKSVIRDVMV